MRAQKYLNSALRSHASGDLLKAREGYLKTLRFDRGNSSALGWLGVIEAQLGRLKEARSLLERALQEDTDNEDFLQNYTIVMRELGQFGDARLYAERLLCLRRNHRTLSNLSACLIGCGDAVGGLERAKESLALMPEFFDALVCSGLALNMLKRHDEALVCFDRAIAINSGNADAWCNRGLTLNFLGQHELARESCLRCLELTSSHDKGWNNLGVAFNSLHRQHEALSSFSKALDLNPRSTEAWSNKGLVLADLNHLEESIVCYERSIASNPNYAEAWNNLGSSLLRLGRLDEALAAFEHAYEINPLMDYLLGNLLHTQLMAAKWEGVETRLGLVIEGLTSGSRVAAPLPLLGFSDNPAVQKLSAELHTKDLETVSRGFSRTTGVTSKIRIGYFSADFRDHAVSYLTEDVFRLHDRSSFEVHAFSFDYACRDSVRERLQGLFDVFHDVSGLSDHSLASLSRSTCIDIAIDLGGHTLHSRPRAWCLGVGALQVNYLGYPGTWGNRCMDYIIGDRFTIDGANREFFTESVVFLPFQFQSNPLDRPSAAVMPSRDIFGLPEDCFVFCCFNNNWKILPRMFSSWMNVLRSVPGSVLWLYRGSAEVESRLRNYARDNGISDERIYFTGKKERSFYMSQYHVADLFLDTFPYNAGTTASDAIWSGLPIVTLRGNSYQSRMASSLLIYAGLPELVCHSVSDYESLCINLAMDPMRIRNIKDKLRNAKKASPLFDTHLFTRSLEQAYFMIYERHLNGLPNQDIYVQLPD